MSIAQLENRLKADLAALQSKVTFVSELKALMDKHKQPVESVVALLQEEMASQGSPAKGVKPAKKGPAARKAAPKKKRPAKGKSTSRPLRTFVHPKTGDTHTSKAPQVDSVIKKWASDLKVDWRTLEK